MEEELQKLYEQYQSDGFALNKAFRHMGANGYDSPEARKAMKALYEGDPKKKSQDSSPSASSSEEVSTEPTSTTPQPQAQEDGDSDYSLTSFDAAIEAMLPGSMSIPESEFQGAPNRYTTQASGAYRINPRTLLLNEDDPDLDRILMSMQVQEFQNFALSASRPVQALAENADGVYKGFLPNGLLDQVVRPGEASINRYGDVLNSLAVAYVLDERTMKLVNDGMDMEQALLENKEWMSKVVGFTDEDFEEREGNPYRLGMKGALFNREMRNVIKQIHQKRDELENDFSNNYFGRAFKQSLPAEYNNVDEEGELTGEARTKLASLEKQLKKRTGFGLDLSGDNKVGNRPMLYASVFPGMRGISIQGELVDVVEKETTNVLNGISYVVSKPVFGAVSAFSDEVYYDTEKGFIDFGQVMAQDFERELRKSEEEMEILSRELNEYQNGITASLANGDFNSAIEQSFLMTASSAPYLAPFLASQRLGIAGTAAASTFLGVAVEANMIKDDKSFDTFIKDGKEYTYYEAAKEAGTYDMTELEKQFEIKTDYWSRSGYLSAVAIGDFSVNYSLNRALLGSYKKGMELELKNWFKGYMHGQRTAIGESAAAMAGSQFLRNIARAEATGGTVDFSQVASDTIEMVLGTAPLTMLLHTTGSARRAMKGTAMSPELIPLNAEEMATLRKQVNEYQKRIANSRDPRFISEANQFINNSRGKAAQMRQVNEQYLAFLNENHPDLFLEVTNATLTLERMKLNYKNTNDPNLKMQIKDDAATVLTRLDEVYATNKADFEKFQGTIRGVREREEARKEEGRTREQDMELLDQMTSPQTRTDQGAVPSKPEPDPTLSPYAKRNDLLVKTRNLAQRAKELFNKTFRSSGGVGNKNLEETIRSRERLESAWIDEIELDAKLFRNLLKDIRRPDGLMGRKLGKAEMKDTQAAIMDLLQGRIKSDDPRLSALKPEHKNQIEYFRTHIDNLSESLIAAIERQPAGSPESMAARQQLIDKIRSNKGAYLTQSYEIFHDGGKRLDMLLKGRDKMTSEVRKAYDDAVEYIADQFDSDITSDVPLTREQRLQKADQQLGAYLLGLKNSKDGNSFGFLGAMDAPFLRAKNNELPPAIARLLGKIDDPMNAYLTTNSKLNSYLSNARWQSELSMVLKESGIGRVGSEFEGMSSPLGRMVRLFPNTPEWMPLHQQFVPEQFAAAFDNLMPLKSIDNALYRGLVGITAKVKVGKTVFAPTTTARNLVSGTFLGMANGHLPFANGLSSTFDAMTQAWGVSAKRAGRGKGKFADQAWRSERKKLIEMGILNDGANSAELMAFLNDSMGGDVQRIIRKGGRQGITEFAQKLYAFGDDFYKVNGYYQERQAFIDSGMSPAQAEIKAAERVRGGYPTYSYISKGAKQLRRFPFAGSFVSFPYEMYRTTMNNFRFMAEDMASGRYNMGMRRAMGLMASLTASYSMSEYSMDKLGLTDEDDEAIRALGPEWQRLSQLVYLGVQDGSPYFMDASYALPHETVTKPLKALFGGDPNAEGYVDNVMSAVKEVVNPYISQDVTFRFISSVATNRTEGGQEIVRLTSEEKEHLGGMLEACLRDENNAYRLFAQFIKQAAPGFVNNITEFVRAGSAEAAYELIIGEDLPNGHPLEEAQDDFQDFFPEKTKYKEYTIRDAAYALLGARVSYLPIDVAASNSIRGWKDFSDEEASDQWHYVVAQPEITMGEEINERVASYIDSFNYSAKKIQRTTNLAMTLGLQDYEIMKMLNQGGVSDEDAGFYLENIPTFPPFISDEKVDRYVESKDIKSLSVPELENWYDTAYKNVAMFNIALSVAYTDQMKLRGMTEEEIEAELDKIRDELGQTNWEDPD